MDPREGSGAGTPETQAFSSNSASYKARLAAALDQQRSASGPSTASFDSQDPSYRARLGVALGEHGGARGDKPISLTVEQPSGKGGVQEPSTSVLRDTPFSSGGDETTRLLFLPPDPETFELKFTDVSGYQSHPGEWIDLRCEGDENESVETLRVMAVAQSLYSVACDVSIRGSSNDSTLAFQLHFPSSSDDIELTNTNSDIIVACGSGSRNHPPPETRIYGFTTMPLRPGDWEISRPKSNCMLKVFVFPRRFFKLPAGSKPTDLASGKRGAPGPASEAVSKRAKGPGPPFNIRALSVATSYVSENTKPTHPLLDLQMGRKIELIGPRPGEKYSVERIENVSETRSSSVWRAIVSLLSPDQQSVVTKVLKTTSSTRSTATMWLREANIHSRLSSGKHPSIVQLLGLDARVHSLYLEDIKASSLADRPWRGSDDRFSGTADEAERVLIDIASALDFVHRNGVAHNDVKPKNILFSPARGAVLIDFGLSTDSAQESERLCRAGTPWYIPPEFLQNARSGRGPPGDVWALGVVMLYLHLGVPIPDRGRDWNIWAVASQTGPEARAAILDMERWLREINYQRTRLGNGSRPVDDLIFRMTTPSREDRITIDEVLKILKS